MKAQERLHRETGLPSSSQEFGGVTLRCGAAGTCLCRSTKAHGGLIPDLRVGRRSGERTPAGRRNAARVGRKPITVLVLRAVVLEAPRNSTRGRTGRREAASGTPSNPHTSGGRHRSRTRNPSSDLVEPGEWATALRARFNLVACATSTPARCARRGWGQIARTRDLLRRCDAPSATRDLRLRPSCLLSSGHG